MIPLKLSLALFLLCMTVCSSSLPVEEQQTENPPCSPGICDRIRLKCKSPQPCDGRILPRGGGYCGCCPICVPYAKEGETCSKSDECSPNHDCVNGVCVKNVNKAQSTS